MKQKNNAKSVWRKMIAHTLKKQFGLVLDYSVESLKKIDSALDEVRSRGDLDDNDRDLAVFTCGLYTGEVLITEVGGEWVQDDKFNMVSQHISVPGFAAVDPIGKCMKRLENGEEDSVFSLVTAVIAMKVLDIGKADDLHAALEHFQLPGIELELNEPVSTK
jgi:hypothetical protein